MWAVCDASGGAGVRGADEHRCADLHRVPVVSQHLRRALRHAERRERVPLLSVLLPLRVSVRAVPVTADGFCARR